MIPQYSPDLAPADYFFFATVKAKLGGILNEEDSTWTMWEQAIQAMDMGEFMAAFNWWLEQRQKCIDGRGEYVKNNLTSNKIR